MRLLWLFYPFILLSFLLVPLLKNATQGIVLHGFFTLVASMIGCVAYATLCE